MQTIHDPNTQHQISTPGSSKEKPMRRFKLSHMIALALLAATLLLAPANATVSLASDVQKAVKHYNIFGWTGGYHLIDEELDWELTKIILSKGGLPTDENKDKLLHGR